jgi:hypothetical protein
VWWPGNKNSPTVTHACRKRWLKWVATLPLGDVNTEAWSSGMGVGRGANNPTCIKKIEKPPRNSAGFCGGGQGLSWAVEPRKEECNEVSRWNVIPVMIFQIYPKKEIHIKWSWHTPTLVKSDFPYWFRAQLPKQSFVKPGCCVCEVLTLFE